MKSLFAALTLLPVLASAQTVSVDARGEDVREVLATIFAQAHRPYALDATIKGRLYVTLDRMAFSKALGVVMLQASLVATERDGVTMIAPKPPAPAPVPVVSPPMPKPLTVARPTPPAITAATYARRVTTRLTRAPLTDVFAALGEQAKVRIEVDPAVPAYRVDAFFVKTSLRYALDRVCKAAGLRYEVRDGVIAVREPGR